MNSTNNATKSRRGGFTLVELLIVIIIIAILAGMMMLTTGSATDRAEATKVISNLRNMKAACLMYYVDNNSWPVHATTIRNNGSTALNKSLEKYLDRSIDAKFTPATVGNQASEKIYIGFYNVANVTTGLPSGVRDKLAQSAVDSGLFAGTEPTAMTTYLSNSPSIFVPMK